MFVTSLLCIVLLAIHGSFTVSAALQEVVVYPNCTNFACVYGKLPCIEIDEALERIQADTVLKLQPGTHTIQISHENATNGLQNISLIGESIENVIINCQDGFGLSFVNVTNLNIVNMTIDNCSLSNTSLENSVELLKEIVDVWYVIPTRIKVGIFLGHCTNLTVSDVLITNTKGIGMLGVNIMGESSLHNVNFTKNIRPSCINSIPDYPFELSPDVFDQIGGGAYFLYQDYINNGSLNSNNHLRVVECNFSLNAECSFAADTQINFQYFPLHNQSRYVVGAGGGLSVVMAQDNFSVVVEVLSSEFSNNDASYGAGAHIVFFTSYLHNSQLKFHKCTFQDNGFLGEERIIPISKSRGGAGLAIFTDLLKPIDLLKAAPIPTSNIWINVTETKFIHNAAEFQGGGVFAVSLVNTPNKENNIIDELGYYNIQWIFSDCEFIGNSARFGAAGYFDQRAVHAVDGIVRLSLSNLSITSNMQILYIYNSSSSLPKSDSSALCIKNLLAVVEPQKHVQFQKNNVTALQLISSIVTLREGSSVAFIQNIGHRGGAIHFEGNLPIIFLYPRTSLLFQSNKATVQGGAIYFESDPSTDVLLTALHFTGCFISPPTYRKDLDIDLFKSSIRIEFTDNEAPLGSLVYGTTLESCTWAQEYNFEHEKLYQELYTNPKYSSTFIFDKEPIGREMISSLPNSLILGNNSGQPIQMYPGQTYYIGIEVLDDFSNVIQSVVIPGFSDFSNSSANYTFGKYGFWYTLSNQNLQFKASGPENLNFSASLLTLENLISTEIEVEFLPCPPGFVFSESNNSCVCDHKILSNVVHCYTDKFMKLTTAARVWFGPELSHYNDATTDDIIISKCHFEYCDASETILTPPDYSYDSQCSSTSHRTGVLCGACAEGYSNVIGTYECKKCDSNLYLLTLPLFGIAGIFVFIVFACLEITIDKGWTEVILFYSNVVIPHNYFVAAQDLYLVIPHRWISLESGYGLCFYKDMTALAKIGLQFVFPAYLYIIMIIFALLCRKISWFSERFSPPKTFVTLYIMCYVSILNTCIEILAGETMTTIGGNTSIRWLIDANQQYFHGWHILLTVLAFILVIIYIIPFPLFLLFPSQAYRFVKKYTPFYDAMWSPFKLKYRFWLALRLIVRVVLAISFKFQLPSYGWCVGLMILFSLLFLQSNIQPYQKTWINILDNFLISNLIVIYFTFFSRYSYEFGQNMLLMRIVRIIFIVSAYIVILAVICWYLTIRFLRLKEWCMCFRCITAWRKSKQQSVKTDPLLDSSAKPITHTSVAINHKVQWQNVARYNSRLRESLLEESMDSFPEP